MKYVGIDLGGTSIAVGVVDRDGQILGKKSVPTRAERGEDAVIADMAMAVRSLLSESGTDLSEIRAVGVGSPGAVDAKTGTVLSACNLNFRNTPLKEKLSRLLGLPVSVENDANCAAWAEVRAGAAKGCRDAVMITLGTGIGGGIVAFGRLYGGFNAFAGEFGHTVIHKDGEPCACGRRGCLEAYASATALIREARREAERRPDSLLRRYETEHGTLDGRAVFAAADAGDGAARAVLDRYVTDLAIGLCNAVKILQPEVLVVGGGLSHAGDALLLPLSKRVSELAYGDRIPKEKQTRIVQATLGNDAGIIGAALLREEP